MWWSCFRYRDQEDTPLARLWDPGPLAQGKRRGGNKPNAFRKLGQGRSAESKTLARALATTALISAPYVPRAAHAAGKVSIEFRGNTWVRDANKGLRGPVSRRMAEEGNKGRRSKIDTSPLDGRTRNLITIAAGVRPRRAPATTIFRIPTRVPTRLCGAPGAGQRPVWSRLIKPEEGGRERHRFQRYLGPGEGKMGLGGAGRPIGSADIRGLGFAHRFLMKQHAGPGKCRRLYPGAGQAPKAD